VTIAEVSQHKVLLPDSPYALWACGDLHDYLRLPHDGTRVEIIGREIVVSPAPTLGHNGFVIDIQKGLFAAEMSDPAFPWRHVHTTELNLVAIENGYIPDLIVLGGEILDAARESEARQLSPDEVELVVEITSSSHPGYDREPTPRRPVTRWSGYARVEIPYYLLIDRDPKVARITLYSIPDQGSGAYLHQDAWDFGETVRLPEPLGFEFSTAKWRPWSD
jgi:Putative restriction endonuclease